MSTTHRLHLGIDDRIATPYLSLPFEVPPGGHAVEVRLSVDATAGAVLDLGCEGAAGWRGWSGGSRRRFVIARESATPGYLPGEPEPGTWNVVLGLHRIPADGVDVVVEIDVRASTDVEGEPDAPVRSVPRGSTRELPTPDGLHWYAGDLHAHTVHSDGVCSVDELAARAASAGLDFLAVTDHNTTSHHAHLARSGARHQLALLPGQEVTTERGHANALGDVGWVDFRQPPATWVEQVDERTGVLSVNHPVEADCAWQHALGRAPRALELWHVSWFRDLRDTAAWAFWQRWCPTPGAVVPVGGSDFHRPGEGPLPGLPTTWVAAEEPSAEAVLAAVRAGRTSISIGVGGGREPDPFRSPLLLRVDDELVALAADGTVLVDLHGRSRRVRGDRTRLAGAPADGPFRLENPAGGVLAISP